MTLSRRKFIALSATASLSMLLLNGCGLFGGGGGAVDALGSDSIVLKAGAENYACNDSIIFTILNTQRRPLSTFQQNTLDTIGQDIRATNKQDKVGAVDDIAIEIDMAYSFNINTYNQNTQASGGKPEGEKIKSLGELFVPGSLIYIQGEDQNGEKYFSNTVITPDIVSENIPFAANAGWNYALLSSPMPATGEVKEGSIIFRVSSQAKNLRMILVSAKNNPDPLKPNSVLGLGHSVFVLPL